MNQKSEQEPLQRVEAHIPISEAVILGFMGAFGASIFFFLVWAILALSGVMGLDFSY